MDNKEVQIPVGRAYGGEPKEKRGGWFMGSFMPEGSIGHCRELGLAVKLLRPGMVDKPHTHKEKLEICANIGRHSWGPITVDGKEIVVEPGEAVVSHPGAVMEWEISERSKNPLVLVVEAPSASQDKTAIEAHEYQVAIQAAQRYPHHRVINFREGPIVEEGFEMEYLELKPGSEESEVYDIEGKEMILALKRHLPVIVNGEPFILNAGKFLLLGKGTRLALGQISENSKPVEAMRIRVPVANTSE